MRRLMHRGIGTITVLLVAAVVISACGAFEVGIEHIPPSGRAGEVDWQATAVALQAEATRLHSGVPQEASQPGVLQVASPLLAEQPEPTLVPTASPPIPDRAMVAYLQGGDIWVKTLPDGEAQRLTHDGRNQEPRWSASGEWLSFIKNPDFPELWIMRRDGSLAQQIATNIGPDAYGWSPLEDRIAFADGSSVKFLHLSPMDDGPAEQVLTQDEIAGDDPNTYIGHIIWSPNGQQIAFTRYTKRSGPDDPGGEKDGLWISDVAGSSLTHVMKSEVPLKGEFILWGWSGDSEYLLYWQAPIVSASILADGVPLYRVPVQGGAPQMVAEVVPVHDDAVQSQPNGLSQVAFIAGSGREMWHNKQLRSVIISGTQEWELTPPDQAASSPAWSPAGDKIAYTGAPDVEGVVGGPEAQAALNQRQVWIALPNELDPYPIKETTGYREEAPQWIDDETLLVARMDSDGRVSLWQIGISGEEEVQVVEEITPAPEWFGYYGHINWRLYFALWRPLSAAQREVQARTMALAPTVVPKMLPAYPSVPQIAPAYPAVSNGRTLFGFLQALYPDLTREDALVWFGKPDATGGTDQEIYKYELGDGVMIWLRFAPDGRFSDAELHTPTGRGFGLVFLPPDSSAPGAGPTATPTPAAMDAPPQGGEATSTPRPEPTVTSTPAMPPTVTPVPSSSPTATPLAP